MGVRLRRVLRLTAFALFLLALAALLLPGFALMWGITRAPCGGDRPPAAPHEVVSFPSSALGRPVRAYFLPGTGAAAIIVPPAHAGGAGAQAAEIALLNRGGFHVLTFESRSCMGAVHSLGYAEVDEVGDALAYLATRPEIDAARVGILGFSSAGATSLMAAARYPQIAAVVAMGGYHDFPAYIRQNAGDSFFGRLFRLSAEAGYRLSTGLPLSVLNPLSAMPAIAPRPVLLIYGSAEPTLPGARQQAAGGLAVTLWVVEGAGHGDYVAVAPEEFERRVLDFFRTALER